MEAIFPKTTLKIAIWVFFRRLKSKFRYLWGFSKKFPTSIPITSTLRVPPLGSADSKYIICFAKYLNFAKIKAIMYFAKFLNALVKPRNLIFFRETNYIFGISRSPASKWYMIHLCSKSLKFFRTSKNGLKSDYFAKIAHKIAKSKYFPDI